MATEQWEIETWVRRSTPVRERERERENAILIILIQ
jgi:hypothetical protein